MNKILLTLLISLGFATGTHASPNQIKPIPEAKIKRMDHKLTKHKAVKRNFKSQKEFQRTQQRRMSRKHIGSNNRGYDNGYNYNSSQFQDNYRPLRQRGHRQSHRGWYLAYRYDRAAFYDNHGYFYGYFNRYGYYFEDQFYRYDRYYTYRDRLNGRGLFDRKYYMPNNAEYYGFSDASHTLNPYHRNYERGFDRY